jgi:hypothetical protein
MRTPRHENSDHPTTEYLAWANMLRRCQNPNNPGYHNYGGRGILVCERWKSYDNFLVDLGRKPSPEHTLDRVNNNGNYEPGNCVWQLWPEQCVNKRTNKLITIDGVTKCAKHWCRHFGVNYGTYLARVNRYGWPVEPALKTPLQRGRKFE